MERSGHGQKSKTTLDPIATKDAEVVP
ncbi:hypothetical protein TRIP_C60046 [Candidatus Zixiibacteriota bacterium]|nr:hypothetical protein TRIP_C60046 [candidate division Zixibacteria bacterium]